MDELLYLYNVNWSIITHPEHAVLTNEIDAFPDLSSLFSYGDISLALPINKKGDLFVVVIEKDNYESNGINDDKDNNKENQGGITLGKLLNTIHQFYTKLESVKKAEILMNKINKIPTEYYPIYTDTKELMSLDEKVQIMEDYHQATAGEISYDANGRVAIPELTRVYVHDMRDMRDIDNEDIHDAHDMCEMLFAKNVEPWLYFDGLKRTIHDDLWILKLCEKSKV